MKLKKNLTSLAFGKTCAGEEAGGQGREGGARRRGGRWPGGRAPCASHLTATAQALLEAAGVPGDQFCSRIQNSVDRDNPWIRLTPRGSAAIRSQRRAHTKGAASFQLEAAEKSATSALRCRRRKAKTLTFCLLFIQLLRL